MAKNEDLPKTKDVCAYNDVLEYINVLKRHTAETAQIFPFTDFKLCLHRAEQYLALAYASLYEQRGFLLIDPEYKEKGLNHAG